MRNIERKTNQFVKITFLINPISQELLAGSFLDGDTIKVNVGEKAGLVFGK